MGLRNNCCDCEDLFAGIVAGDAVQVQSVGNTTENGAFSRIVGNVVILDEGTNGEVRICCANIFSVSPQ
ncbi:hypothetical protein QNH48_24495 [Neobacillus sp. YX16]|uniref:hypothetical protein n=1 Tax=Neobacillus sp. YX16 TaxID=3047874 RepID=UPI0024C22F1A|nr:hypothetical protein [Neobacillus sp. YX16]WHZ02101.1 hypothetical protein QNH48_24495 [Neobacillus sp. YX16]